MALQGKDLRKLVVREVMSKRLPQVPRTAPVERVTYILSHENPAVFVEMGDARFEILTKYDLMSTVASLMEPKRLRAAAQSNIGKPSLENSRFQRALERFHPHRRWRDGFDA